MTKQGRWSAVATAQGRVISDAPLIATCHRGPCKKSHSAAIVAATRKPAVEASVLGLYGGLLLVGRTQINNPFHWDNIRPVAAGVTIPVQC
jgi:hypothetical protein